MGGQDFLVLTGLKLLVMINSQQTIFISGAQGPLILMGSKDKDDQAAIQCPFYLNVLWPGHLYQKF